jgi:superfamily I DNA and/or RNA helicase
MICELVRQGKKVGVTANSHAVIGKLLSEVLKAASELRVDARVVRKAGEDDIGDHDGILGVDSDDEVLDALREGKANIVGGTAWLWSKDKACDAVDVLFVDEAGQMALANVIAVSQAANSVVLLGDPQQLEQPRKGTHPDGVGVSALQHLLRGGLTIPKDRGIFLPETWRMAPSICSFTSQLFYDGRLESRQGLERQRLTGVASVPDQGLMRIDVKHDGNRNYATEEVDEIEALVARLTSPGAQWIDSKGQSHALRGQDILVVAPYNAHVTRLKERLAITGVVVGTVDKFQGQEAPVVIYSMATSRPEDAPRGMEFLYSLNRLNVATSRARCLAVLVASPRLFDPECRTPRQMKLANGLAMFVEMAES